MAKKKTTKKPTNPAAKPKGRPQGSQNHPLEHAEGTLTRCPKCSSTERAPYSQRHVQQHAGIDADGRPYTHIVRRRTHCLTCGQHRVDRHFEYSPPKK